MNREETKKIIRIMVDSYPNYKPSDLSETIDVWCMMLEDFTYQQVALALKAYILSDTSGFAPSIGALVGKMQMINAPKALGEIEAWAMVRKAINNGYYGAEEEFAKLPELVQKSVGSAGQLRQWALSSLDTIETVVSSNFMRTYRAEAKRSEEIARMPVEVQKMISRTNSQPQLENGCMGLIESEKG